MAEKNVEVAARLRDIPRRSFSDGRGSGRSVAWLARLLGVQEVVSSNLTAPTIQGSAGPVANTQALFCQAKPG